MKKIIIYLAVSLLGIGSLVAQEDPNSKAQKYLDILNEKNKSYKTLEIEFELSLVNITQQINHTQDGKIKIKGDKSYLKFSDTDIILDGKAMYVVERCAAIIYDKREGGDLRVDPSYIFTLENSFFKHKMMKETTLDGKEVAVIEMFPKAPKEANVISITLTIDKKKMEVYIIKGWIQVINATKEELSNN